MLLLAVCVLTLDALTLHFLFSTEATHKHLDALTLHALGGGLDTEASSEVAQVIQMLN